MPCETCGLTQRVDELEPGAVAECIRCGSVIRKRGWGGVEVPAALALAALVLGLVNAIVRPVLVLLTLPVTILTLGLFIFVLNGLLFWMVASWLEGFHVAGFWSGVLGAILFSLVSWLLSALVQR